MHSSPGLQNDDRMIQNYDALMGREVIISEKIDGEGWNMLRDKSHPRSENSNKHASRSHAKALHGRISAFIPDGIQYVGENVFGKHSIYYDQLTSFFYLFGIIDNFSNKFLSVDETISAANTLKVPFVPILYRGPFTKETLKFKCPEKSVFGDKCEGFVIRAVDEIKIDDWDKLAAKWVRKDHVETDEHWMNKWTPNKLREGL